MEEIVEEFHLKAQKQHLAWSVYLLLGLTRIRDQHECILILHIDCMSHLILLGQLAPNPYLHSIISMPDTSPVIQTLLTITFKIPCIQIKKVQMKNLYIL